MTMKQVSRRGVLARTHRSTMSPGGPVSQATAAQPVKAIKCPDESRRELAARL